MANNWAGSDFIYVYNFDTSPGLAVPSVGAGSLVLVNSPSLDANAQQGDKSGLFQTTTVYGYVNDLDLSSTFPGKSGGSNRDFTICFWLYQRQDIPTRMAVTKSSVGTSSSFLIGTKTTTDYPIVYIGDGGANLDFFEISPGLSLNTWYHFAVTWKDNTRTATIRVWDDTAGAISHNGSTQLTYFMGATSHRMTINRDETAFGAANILIDELAISPTVHDSTDTDLIRQGLLGDQSTGGGIVKPVVTKLVTDLVTDMVQ